VNNLISLDTGGEKLFLEKNQIALKFNLATNLTKMTKKFKNDAEKLKVMRES